MHVLYTVFRSCLFARPNWLQRFAKIHHQLRTNLNPSTKQLSRVQSAILAQFSPTITWKNPWKTMSSPSDVPLSRVISSFWPRLSSGFFSTLPSFTAIRASISIRAGTNSCHRFVTSTPPKTNMAMENPPFEDWRSCWKWGDLPIAMLVFRSENWSNILDVVHPPARMPVITRMTGRFLVGNPYKPASTCHWHPGWGG